MYFFSLEIFLIFLHFPKPIKAKEKDFFPYIFLIFTDTFSYNLSPAYLAMRAPPFTCLCVCTCFVGFGFCEGLTINTKTL